SEQRQRWQGGEQIPAAAYLQEYPQVAAAASCAVELIYNEILLREEQGETPQLQKYLRQFPQFASQLERVLAVHQALHSSSLFGPSGAPSDRGTAGDVQTLCPTCGSGLQRPDTLRTSIPLTGRQLGKFQLLETLGVGAFGVVWLARDTELGRLVALKMPHP